MSTEEHLIENALYAYHRAVADGTPVDKALESDALVTEQAEQCGVGIGALAEMVNYVYWTLLDDDERKRKFGEGKK